MEIDYFTPAHAVIGAIGTVAITEILYRGRVFRDARKALGYSAAIVFAAGGAKEAADLYFATGTPDMLDVGVNSLGIYVGSAFSERSGNLRSN